MIKSNLIIFGIVFIAKFSDAQTIPKCPDGETRVFSGLKNLLVQISADDSLVFQISLKKSDPYIYPQPDSEDTSVIQGENGKKTVIYSSKFQNKIDSVENLKRNYYQNIIDTLVKKYDLHLSGKPPLFIGYGGQSRWRHYNGPSAFLVSTKKIVLEIAEECEILNSPDGLIGGYPEVLSTRLVKKMKINHLPFLTRKIKINGATKNKFHKNEFDKLGNSTESAIPLVK